MSREGEGGSGREAGGRREGSRRLAIEGIGLMFLPKCLVLKHNSAACDSLLCCCALLCDVPDMALGPDGSQLPRGVNYVHGKDPNHYRAKFNTKARVFTLDTSTLQP